MFLVYIETATEINTFYLLTAKRAYCQEGKRFPDFSLRRAFIPYFVFINCRIIHISFFLLYQKVALNVGFTNFVFTKRTESFNFDRLQALQFRRKLGRHIFLRKNGF